MPTLSDRAARFDPLSSYRFTTVGWVIVTLLVGLLLLPAVVYPLGPDEGLFFVSGQKLLQGAIHYRDIVDIKPPLIYYLYAGAIWLLGPDALSIHIVDVLLQGVTCVLIVGLVRRVGGSDLWGAAAAIIYALLYVILNYGNVAQPESYAGLLGIPMIRLMLFRRRPAMYLVIGLLGGVLFLFKFSLMAVLGVVAIADLLLFRQPWITWLRNWLAAGIGFGMMAALLYLYLLAFDATEGFMQMQEFTRGYVGVQLPSAADWFRTVSKQIPAYLSDNYSVLIFLATATGISFSIPLRQAQMERFEERPDAHRLLRVCTLLFLVLLATVAIESKFLPYHFSRFYAFSAILAAFGGMAAIQSFLAMQRRDLFAWGGAASVALLLLIFSPLPRFAWHGSGVLLGLLRGPDAYDQHYSYQSEGDTILTFTAIQEAGEYLRRHRRPEDHVLLASSAGGLVAYEAGYVPHFKLYHFAFVAAPFGPQEWKEETRDYLINERPRFIVAQKHNREPTLSGTRMTSEETLRHLSGIDSLIDHAYRLAQQGTVFNIYERNGETR